MSKNCFRTGETVDFVLAYCEDNPFSELKRQVFEENLKKCGLLLETEEDRSIIFVKIHVPHTVLAQYAELLKLRLPLKVDIFYKETESFIDKILSRLPLKLDQKLFPTQKYRLTHEYSRDKEYLFETSLPNFFKTSARIIVVDYILEREKFGDVENNKGVKQLLTDGVYLAAYPIHDGKYKKDSMRALLLEHWASPSKCLQYQPLDDIKDYFGVKFALYFTWLGFYTYMLIPAAVVGILCIIYASTTLHTDNVIKEICSIDVIMCPRCDRYCDYWKLNDTCTYGIVEHFVDNNSTVFFAIFMSFWSTLYLELWKRYSAGISHRWSLTGFDLLAEPPRPEYLKRLSKAKRRKNIVTQQEEPSVSFWKVKLPKIVISFSLAALWTLLALAVVFGVVIYRMSLITSREIFTDTKNYGIYLVPITAACINLACIQFLDVLYKRLAGYLTEMELQRTQTEYEDSLALKIYLFQFINYYSSIFYIAFIKGKFVGYPANYNRIFSLRQEECNPGGCLMELTIQLGIIMIGNQAINTAMEMVFPFLQKTFKKYLIYNVLRKNKQKESLLNEAKQWTSDYYLNDFESSTLFTEYLEMVLQYGFVTLFVTAFPLGPLFALVNNIFEMRLDAKKFIKYYRRPVASRVNGIGVWLPILSVVSRISVATNAFIIAFSSDFIPFIVYTALDQETGFMNFSLSVFDTRDFPKGYGPEHTRFNTTTCRYVDFRNPPDHDKKYERPLIYWQILAARLGFVVIYQNIVSFVIMAVKRIIPNIPKRLNDQIKREAYIVNEEIIKYEAQKIREKC